MPDIHFYCVNCGKSMAAPPPFACKTMECSACLRIVPVPALIHVAGGSAGCVAALPPGILEIELKFLCGKCESRLEIDARWEGRMVTCPVCNAPVAVPWWSANASERAAHLPLPERAPSAVPAVAPLLSAAEIEFLSGSAEANGKARLAG